VTGRIVPAGYDNEKTRKRLDRVVHTIRGRIAHHHLPGSLSPSGQDLVEGDDADERDLRQLRELRIAQGELTGELVVVGGAPQLVLELRLRPLDGARLRATDRGTQSKDRSSSMIAPLTRAIA
jgi:hypothetical protein